MSVEGLDEIGHTGAALGLLGGLLAGVPALEQLLYFGQDWLNALVGTLVAIAALVGVVLAVNAHQEIGGALAGVAGVPLIILGPPLAGVLAVLGGVLLYVDARQERLVAEASNGETG